MKNLVFTLALVGSWLFTTGQVNPPYFENFDGVTAPAYPSGWTEIDNTGDVQSVTSTDHGTPIPSSPNCIELNDGNIVSGDTAMLISPQLVGLSSGNYQIRFKAALENTSSNSYLIIGTLSNPANGATFVPYDTLFPAALSTSFSEFIIQMTDLAKIGSREYVGMAHGADIYELYIDDFHFEALPSCPSPNNLMASNISGNSADLSWTTGGASNWQIQYGPSGFTPGAGTIVTPVTTNPYTLTGLSGSASYDAYVRDSCGPGDVSIWVGPVSFTTLVQPINCVSGTPTIVFSEDFENSTSFTGNINNGNGSWLFDNNTTGSSNTGPSGPHSGTYYIYAETSSGGPDTISMVSPAIDLSAGSGEALLTFWLHAYGDDIGELNINVGNSSSGPFSNAYHRPAGELQTDELDPYEQQGVNLNSYVGQTIYIEVQYIRGPSFEGDLAIDLFQVETCLSCGAPSNLMVSNITSSSAELSWTSGGASNWQIEYGPQGFALGNGTLITPVSTNPYTLSNLDPATVYDVYVRDSCAPGDVSPFVGPQTFQTPCLSALSGGYTINPGMPTGGTNYNSFNAAVQALNFCGISGPVVFTASPGTYAENITLIEVAGSSPTNTITFDGVDSSQVEITHTSTTDEPTVYFNGGDNFIFQNLTISNNSSSDGWGVMLQNSSDSNSILACHIKMPITTISDIAGIVTSASLSSDATQGDNADYLTVEDCRLTGGESGIHLEGDIAGLNKGHRILNNIFRNQDDKGIEVDDQEDLLISGNDIASLNGSFADGIYLVDINDYEVSGNRVVAPDYGIYINDGNDAFSPLSRSRVVNNMTSSSGDYGLYLNDIEATDVFYNSSLGEPALRLNDQLGLDIRNNIFVSTADFAFESDDSLNPSDVVDYNLYNSGAANPFNIDGTTYADLAAWQAAAPAYNANSLEGDPMFFAPDDLHLLGTLADGEADPIPSVTQDIDGDARSGSNPDIGADEYTPASCLPSDSLSASNVTGNSVDLDWIPGSGSSFNIEYGPAGYAPGSGTLISGVSSPPYTLSGLQSTTTYDVYVQDDCGGGDLSIFAGPASFTTLISPLNCGPGKDSIVFYDDFEDTTMFSGNIDNGNGSWRFEDATTGSSNTGPSGPQNGNFYIYAETSSGGPDTISMVSPAIDLSGVSAVARLNFWLHAYGDDIGELNINVGNNAAGPFSNVYNRPPGELQTDETDPFVQVEVDLSAYAGQVIYIEVEYIRGPSFEGDLALDNLRVEACYGPACLPTPPVTVVDTSICQGDSIFLAGAYRSTPGTYNDTLTTAAGCDSVLSTNLTVNPAYFIAASATICQGDSILLAGAYQTLAGVYNDSLTTVNGCDSVISTTLTVNPSYLIADNRTICEGDSVFLGGAYQTLAGVYSDSLLTGGGCDSVIVTTLTVNPVSVTTVTASICQGDSIFLAGAYQTTAGAYVDTLSAANGCDSLLVTSLSVNPVYNVADNAAICQGDSIFLAGDYQTTSGVYIDSLTTAAGCDSIVTTTLAVGGVKLTVQNISICQGDSILIDGIYVSSPGVFNDTLSTPSGCDSVHSIVLSVLPVSTTNVTVDICAGDSIFLEGAYQTMAGVYTDTLTASNGCDSIVITTLQVLPNSVLNTTADICPGDSIFLGGAWQTLPGVYTDVFVAANGCDSLVNTTLNWLPAPATADTVKICEGDSVLVDGIYRKQNGSFLATFATAQGCDSVHTTTVVVIPTAQTSEMLTICAGDSVLIFGNYENMAGAYSDTFTGPNGCDSIHTVNLMVDPVVLSTLTASICPGDSIFLEGAWQTMAGTYYDTLSSVNGCDSILATVLSVISTPGCGAVDSLSVVSDSSWRKSTVITPSNKQGFWPGADTIPADATFSLFATVGQPYPWGGLKVVEGSQPITSLENIRYFKKTFNLSDPTGYHARIMMYMDDGTEIYINGHLLAREEDMDGENRKGLPHDLVIDKNNSVTNGYNGNDMFDMVLASVDLDTVLQAGSNEILVVLRNPAGGHNIGGFSFRMDLNRSQIPNIPSKQQLEGGQWELDFYPNPTDGLVNIIVPPIAEEQELFVFDLSGKLVYRQVISSQASEVQVDLSKLKQGIYNLQLRSADLKFIGHLYKQ